VRDSTHFFTWENVPCTSTGGSRRRGGPFGPALAGDRKSRGMGHVRNRRGSCGCANHGDWNVGSGLDGPKVGPGVYAQKGRGDVTYTLISCPDGGRLPR